MKDASPVPLLDVTNLPTPRKFLDTSQYSTPGSSSGKCLILQPLNCFVMSCSSWAGARVDIPFEQHCWFSLKLNALDGGRGVRAHARARVCVCVLL